MPMESSPVIEITSAILEFPAGLEADLLDITIGFPTDSQTDKELSTARLARHVDQDQPLGQLHHA